MEKSQANLFQEVLHTLDREGVLSRIILIGSWCLIIYKEYFKDIDYFPSIRTRDIDFLIPIPCRMSRKIDMGKLLESMGFVLGHKGSEGYITFSHPELTIEFLVPDRGKGFTGPYPLPQLGINAQPLRYLDLLTANPITIDFKGLPINIPPPAQFALHKLIVSSRRLNKDKSGRDYEQATMVLRSLIKIGNKDSITYVFHGLPKKWQQNILKVLSTSDTEDITVLLQSIK